MVVRNWKSQDNNRKIGQSILHETNWQAVMVKRNVDSNTNVGVNGEYEPEITTFNIRARIDELASNSTKNQYIGLVEDHILLMMSKGDHWLVQTPNDEVIEYRVTKITGDEIILERL